MKKFDDLKKICEICGSTNIRYYFSTSNAIKIYKCSNCKVQFMNPQYSDEYLIDYYSHYTNEKSEWEEELFHSHNFCLDIIEKYLNTKGSLFDIGCGYGHLLIQAKKRGWQINGYDIDCKTTERVGKTIDIELLCGNFTKLNFSEESFDVITMLHVIEHLKNPQEYLQLIFKILKKDGIFFLALPNIRSRSAVFKFYLEKIGMRKKNRGSYYDTSHHLWYFSQKSIRNCLTNSGFTIINMRSGRHVKPIKSKVKKYIVENILDKILWRSTMLVVAKK